MDGRSLAQPATTHARVRELDLTDAEGRRSVVVRLPSRTQTKVALRRTTSGEQVALADHVANRGEKLGELLTDEPGVRRELRAQRWSKVAAFGSLACRLVRGRERGGSLS
jgi:hypothetical protein